MDRKEWAQWEVDHSKDSGSQEDQWDRTGQMQEGLDNREARGDRWDRWDLMDQTGQASTVIPAWVPKTEDTETSQAATGCRWEALAATPIKVPTANPHSPRTKIKTTCTARIKAR